MQVMKNLLICLDRVKTEQSRNDPLNNKRTNLYSVLISNVIKNKGLGAQVLPMIISPMYIKLC